MYKGQMYLKIQRSLRVRPKFALEEDEKEFKIAMLPSDHHHITKLVAL